MERRTFLQLVSVGTAVVGGLGVAGLGRMDRRALLAPDDGAPLFPGLPLSIELLPDAGGPCHVAVVLSEGAARHVVASRTLSAGERHTLALPFVDDTLRAGTWRVDVIAARTDGRAHDISRVGSFRVRGLRFGV